jgi:hypothetical protein
LLTSFVTCVGNPLLAAPSHSLLLISLHAPANIIAQFFISLHAPNHQGDDDSEPVTGRQRRADSAIPAEEQPSPDHIDLANALRQEEDSDGEDDERLEEQPGLDHIYLGEARSNKRKTVVAQMRWDWKSNQAQITSI